jgi:anti-anti-sigma factor
MNVGAARVPATKGPAVVRFPAEVDLSNGDLILAEALRLLREGAPGLVMDLGGCSFCDSSGPNAIFRAKVRADAAGVPLAVVVPETGVVRRICDIAGVTRRIPVASDLESALAEIAAVRRPGPAGAGAAKAGSAEPGPRSPGSAKPRPGTPRTAPVNAAPGGPAPAGHRPHGPDGGRRAS